MASDSIAGACTAYFSAVTVPNGIGQVQAYRDVVPPATAGGPVGPPYGVVRADGGRVYRDMEHHSFGPVDLTVTVYAATAADARAIALYWCFGGQKPEVSAGVEAAGALAPYLSGYANPTAGVFEEPREYESPIRRAEKREHAYQFRLKVDAHRA